MSQDKEHDSANRTTACEQTLQRRTQDKKCIIYSKLPWAIWLLEKFKLCFSYPTPSYKTLVFLLTFFCYTSYHLSRKPTSVVKVALCPHCGHCNISGDNISNYNISSDEVPGWIPFNGSDGNKLLGILDYSWLFAYALSMYFSGFLSDRLNLRYFLTVGMLGSGLSICLVGVAYFANIHKLYYFILVQVFGGILQSTGWPGVVAVMSHWFGKQNRGLIMGIWNSHTSIGNILGTIIPSFWADCDGDFKPWGWSYLVPGFIIIFMGILTYFLLVTDPVHVGIPPPIHHFKEDFEALELSRKSYQPQTIKTSHELELHSDSEEVVLVKPSVNNGHKDMPPVENSKQNSPKAINFLRALVIPGVVEYSLTLFFNKLVSYTFLYWLPLYVKFTHPDLSGEESDWLSTTFDLGGILGGIVAGVISDRLNARAITCAIMLIFAVPFLFILHSIDVNLGGFIALLIVNGALVNGPYGMITTAVSSDLGTHPSLKENTNAKATVTAIIDGTGSLGAAFGPLFVGLITDYWSWDGAFYLLMASSLISALWLSRLVIKEVLQLCKKFRSRHAPPENSRPLELQRLTHLSDNDPSASESEYETPN